MAKYDVTITSGSGSIPMKAGTYTVTVDAPGFDNTTLAPTSYTAPEGEDSATFTVTAQGSLTLVFTDDGTETGTRITGGKIRMTDSEGTTYYTEELDIGEDGEITFANVPFITTGTGYTLYFEQTESDAQHYPATTPIVVQMTSENQTAYVQNTVAATKTFTLNDSTYGLPVANATLSFD